LSNCTFASDATLNRTPRPPEPSHTPNLLSGQSGHDPRVLTLTEPRDIAGHLPALADDTIRAIRVPSWRTADECTRAIEALGACIDDTYAQERSLGKGGVAVYDFEGDEAGADEYFARAKKWNGTPRRLMRPYGFGPDLVAGILSETHPGGVMPEQLRPGSEPCMGIIREFRCGSRAGPHLDRTDWDWPNNAAAATHLALFSFLEYHSVAVLGGELVLYGDRLNRDEWTQARLSTSLYEISREPLSKDPVIIKPERGELIVFDAHRVHEVREILIGVRHTASCFFAWRGPLAPLGRFA